MSTGPGGGSGGTTGPGFLSTLLDKLRASRALSMATAAQAGARATSARPLSDEQRQDNYRRQNGTWAGGRLTPRQHRRAEHKANVATKRASVAS